MIETILILLFISVIFLLGFFGNLFFKKTRISDIFFLIIIGFLFGSGLHIIPMSEITLLKSFAPLFGAIALIILLFEGGLHLNFYRVIKELNKAASFTILVFFVTVTLITILLKFVFGFPLLYGILLGAIVGGVSSAVVIPLIKNSKAKPETKTLLTLESAMTDALCVVIVIAIVEIIIAKTASVQFVAQGVFSAFAIATVVGVIGGIVWLKILRDFTSTKDFSYLLTLSFLFALYALTEYVKGNGAFCALIFGLVLGNAPEILKIFRMKEFNIDKTITRFQSEISLFVKTFFFVFLGIIVELKNLSLEIILIVIGIVVISILSRIIVSKLLFSKNKVFKKDSNYIVSLHARGLAAAVLGTYALTNNIINPYTEKILPIAFLVIILTNLTTTILFFISERSAKKEKLKELDKVKDVVEPVTK